MGFESSAPSSTSPQLETLERLLNDSATGESLTANSLTAEALVAISSTTADPALKQAASYLERHFDSIKDLSPKGGENEIHTADLILLGELDATDREMEAAIQSRQFLNDHFSRIDTNKNGRLSKRELRLFGEQNPQFEIETAMSLSQFKFLARASGKGYWSISQEDLSAVNREEQLPHLMYRKYSDTEFIRRCQWPARAAGIALAALAQLSGPSADGEPPNTEGAYQTGLAIGYGTCYAATRIPQDNYYTKKADRAMRNLFMSRATGF